MNENKSQGEIVIYRDSEGPELKVTVAEETVWLNQSQMADLFKTSVANINQHIKSLYNEAELSKDPTIKKYLIVQKEGKRDIERSIDHYNLDVIISVGYRVKSKRGTQFRIWATQRLRDYILKGFAVNQDRLKEQNEAKLKELEGAVKLLQGAIETRRLEGYEKELLNIITDYASTWVLLSKYDRGQLAIEGTTKKTVYVLDYEKTKKYIERFKERLLKNKQASDLFGKEVSNKLQALLGNIEQTFDSKTLYPSLEEKAAHLLYFAIKDHPFADGNKRIGALMFLLYLVENRRMYNKKGERLVTDNTLTALALLIAESKPDQKDVMAKLIVNLINKK